MDNLNTLLKFININKNFSDYNLVQNYINSLNFSVMPDNGLLMLLSCSVMWFKLFNNLVSVAYLL